MKKQKRSRYYTASLVLAVLFVGLAIAFPVWLDHTRNRTDMRVFDTDLSEVEGRSTEAAEPARKIVVSSPSSSIPLGNNQDCRSYVFARCNALRVAPRPCMEVARTAMDVPPEGGMDACKKTVDPMLNERKATAIDDGYMPMVVGSVVDQNDQPVAVDENAASDDEAGKKSDKEKDAKQEAAHEPEKRLAPVVEAEKMERMAQLVEELQVAQNNYGVSTQIQALRLQELRRIVAEVDTPEAKELFNSVNNRFAPKDPPKGGGRALESKMVDARDGQDNMTTAEIQRARELKAQARQRAGLSTTGDSGGSGRSVQSVRPSSVGASSSSTVKAVPASSASVSSINSSKAPAAIRP